MMTTADARTEAPALPRAELILGTCGSIAVAVASFGSPMLERAPGVQQVLGAGSFDLSHWTYLAGVLVLAVSWLWLGRAVLAGAVGVRVLRWTTALWSVPMLFAAPVASRDAWAYAAQATVLRDGGNPYTDPPSTFPGPHLPYVSGEWRTETSPYGPVWLWLALIAVALSGTHVLVTVLLLRLICVAGLALTVATVPTLASRFGGSPAVALWLLCANPLVVVITLGGVHNDLLVGGLMAPALWFVTSSGTWWQTIAPAVVACTAATEIKLPAAAALAFLPYLWLRRDGARPGGRSFALTVLGVAAAAAALAALVVAASGLGFGWLHQLNRVASGVLWLSLPLVVAWVWAAASGHAVQLHDAVTTQPHVITAVTVVLLVALISLWILAWRREPVRMLAAALALSVTISATVQPWYVPWALLGVAVIVTGRRSLLVLAGGSVCALLCMHPNGASWLAKAQLLAVAVVAAVLVWVVLARGRVAR